MNCMVQYTFSEETLYLRQWRSWIVAADGGDQLARPSGLFDASLTHNAHDVQELRGEPDHIRRGYAGLISKM